MDGLLDRDIIKNKMNDLKQEKAQFESRIHELNSKTYNWVDEEKIYNYFMKSKEDLLNGDNLLKCKVIKTFIGKIKIYPDRIDSNINVSMSVKSALEVETVEVVADKGYESREDILNCVMNSIVPNVALKYDKDEGLYTIDYEEAKITEEIKNSTKPEDIFQIFIGIEIIGYGYIYYAEYNCGYLCSLG